MQLKFVRILEATVEVCPTVQKTLTNLSEANKTIDYWTEVEATSELNIVELDHQTIATTTELTVSLLPCPITIPRQIPAPISFPVEVPAPMAPISFQDARCFADTARVVLFKRSLNWLTIRQLQKRAREARIPKYSRMPKLKMIAALQAV